MTDPEQVILSLETRDTDLPLSETVAREIRDLLIAGGFAPGERLSEHQVAARFAISRNTLREVFRLLTSQGLLVHVPHRGVFVAAPDAAAVVDIYRVRGVVQSGAVARAHPAHPAVAKMQALAEEAVRARDAGDWKRVGTLNMEFHRAMVELCDSPRLSASFDLVLAELRLIFGQLKDTAHLHEPYIAMNSALVEALASGDVAGAQVLLDTYLRRSETAVLAALQRNS